MVSRADLTRKERKTIRPLPEVIELSTANGYVKAKSKVKVNVNALGDETIDAIVLDDCPSILSLGHLCEIAGFDFHWIHGDF